MPIEKYMLHNIFENPNYSQQFKLISTHDNYKLIVLIPLFITFCIHLLIQYRLYTLGKSALETIALISLAGFLLICLVRFAFNKNNFFIWASCLLLVLFVREVHPPGSSAGVYLGILVLFYIAYKVCQQFPLYLQNTRLINFIAMGFFTYFIAVTIDQRFWKFIPGEEITHVPLEESLEVIGHLFIGFGLALFSSTKTAQPKEV